MLTDEHGKPLKAEADQKEAPPKNGESKKTGQQDVRTIPTGTLFYNLAKMASREDGCMAMIQQFEMMKAQQKMLEDPQPLAMAKQELDIIEQTRYIIARELNIRFAAIDVALAKERGIEIYEPGELASEPPKEAQS